MRLSPEVPRADAIRARLAESRRRKSGFEFETSAYQYEGRLRGLRSEACDGSLARRKHCALRKTGRQAAALSSRAKPSREPTNPAPSAYRSPTAASANRPVFGLILGPARTKKRLGAWQANTSIYRTAAVPRTPRRSRALATVRNPTQKAPCTLKQLAPANLRGPPRRASQNTQERQRNHGRGLALEALPPDC